MRLYWKVVAINGAVLCLALLALVLGPVSVSRRTVASEVLVLALGLAAILLTNALLLRSSLAPVDRVLRAMADVDPTDRRARIPVPRSGPGRRLVEGFNTMLHRLEEEQSASNAKALAAQEAERHRIAQELHDEVGQHLTVVLLGLKQLEGVIPDEQRHEVALLRESARNGLDDVRRVARRLRPGVLEDLGLTSALAALTNDFARHHPAAVQRVIAPGLPGLLQDTELVIYRVAQEALTNTVRHSGAERVTLSLVRVGSHVVLEVTDDGVGFDTTRFGAGVRGMHERSRLVGGDLQIASTPLKGTTVRLAVPCLGDQR
ncbi:MAG TPA: histidine kinase [Nocardioides sp.]|uniref:HAMP domain-containing sensor histidine kinase n=1 Tax=Nocardioides sp. TaxID=35761 RepID=UPI002E311DE0|nr:histidine kinase [Nocardioides sp.]HEX5090356.1 histidine kinase [Nocardioides sp.]